MKKKTASSKTAPELNGDALRNRLSGRTREWEQVIEKRLDSQGRIRPEFWTRFGCPGKTKPAFRSGSGEFEIKEVYTPLDIDHIDPVDQIGMPGLHPYTRGRDPLGPQAAHLPMKFYSGFGSSKEVKKRYQDLYASGSRYISMALDLPTQIGRDSDWPMARGEVGKVGVALDTFADVEDLLDWLPLNKVTIGTVGNCIGPWALSLFCLLGEKKGCSPNDMKVTLQNDPFKEYTGRGTYIFPPRVALDLASDVVVHVCRHLPHQWEPQYLCTTTLRWGGCNASQEIGFGIANLVAYIEAVQKKGIRPEEFIPRVNMHMTTDNDLFEEVAKFRAIRRLWAKIIRERFGTDDPRALSLRITIYTGAHRMTAQQPLNNIVRSTAHVLASMLGGVENMSIPSHDEALALPTLAATRLASLIPHILKEECMVANTADPLGGSYYVEHLTDRLESGGRYWYDQAEAQRGAIAAIENGYYIKQMADGMHRYQMEVEQGERTVVGVNKFTVEEEDPIEVFSGNARAEQGQIRRLRKVRRERNNDLVKRCLARLAKTAGEKAKGKDRNIIPDMMEAVRAYATVGEIFDVLRDIFGEYRPPLVF